MKRDECGGLILHCCSLTKSKPTEIVTIVRCYLETTYSNQRQKRLSLLQPPKDTFHHLLGPLQNDPDLIKLNIFQRKSLLIIKTNNEFLTHFSTSKHIICKWRRAILSSSQERQKGNRRLIKQLFHAHTNDIPEA